MGIVANKAMLTQKIAKSSGVSLRDASACVDIIIDTVVETLAEGKRVELRGFGTFSSKLVPQKKYPSSFSEQKTVIPSHKRIVFRPCRKLREAVWNKGS